MSNKGIGRFESLTIMFVMIVFIAIGLYFILGAADDSRFKTMDKNSLSFVDMVTRNSDAFVSYRSYYLQQAMDDGYVKQILSPFGKCDPNESKVDYDGENVKYFVTLKCGDYLIKERDYLSKSVKIYKVGKWTDTRTGKDDQAVTKYSCDDCGVDGYFDEPLFVHYYNKANGTSYTYIDEIKQNANVTSKEQFRTLDLAYKS